MFPFQMNNKLIEKNSIGKYEISKWKLSSNVFKSNLNLETVHPYFL